jgi:hypothetical protein
MHWELCRETPRSPPQASEQLAAARGQLPSTRGREAHAPIAAGAGAAQKDECAHQGVEAPEAEDQAEQQAMSRPAWIMLAMIGTLLCVALIGWHGVKADRDAWRRFAIAEDTEVLHAAESIRKTTELLQLCSDLYVNGKGDAR